MSDQVLLGQWDYQGKGVFAYGCDTTYKKAAAFLDEACPIVEDWGCGAGYAKKFFERSLYIGIDGSPGPHTSKVVDLREYESEADGIMLRHVLEHNHEWSRVLGNAVRSFRRRLAVILFTKLANETRQIALNRPNVPVIAFKQSDIVDHFKSLELTQETVKSKTQYGREHLFYVEKKS